MIGVQSYLILSVAGKTQSSAFIWYNDLQQQSDFTQRSLASSLLGRAFLGVRRMRQYYIAQADV
jgi:hypothetical protein